MGVRQRQIWFGAIVILALIGFTLFLVPGSSLQHGSTYSRAPSGYGAWYAYMQTQGADIQRWQKPLDELTQPVKINEQIVPIRYQAEDGNAGSQETSSQKPLDPPLAQALLPMPQSLTTLLQIDNGSGQLNIPPVAWIEQGNVFVRLGVAADVIGYLQVPKPPVTEAPFTSRLPSSVGEVKIETSRRFTPEQLPEQDTSNAEFRNLLDDSYGSVVFERQIGKGRLISAVTPHLAANAYQDEAGNFKFLEQLVTAPGYSIWVDEYSHGYKDAEVIAEETSQSVLSYLANTPILLVAIQAGVILLVLLWGLNQRLGPPIALSNATTDNSTAYIQALAGVLRQANCSEFVVETLGKAEQLHIQRSLGLGNDLLDPETVVEAWVQQTGRSPVDLEEILRTAARHRRLSEKELLTWLEKVKTIRQTLPN